VDARTVFALATLVAVLGIAAAAGNLGPDLPALQVDLRVAAVCVGAGLVLAAPALLRMRRQALL
jgi:hypothetical protein